MRDAVISNLIAGGALVASIVSIALSLWYKHTYEQDKYRVRLRVFATHENNLLQCYIKNEGFSKVKIFNIYIDEQKIEDMIGMIKHCKLPIELGPNNVIVCANLNLNKETSNILSHAVRIECTIIEDPLCKKADKRMAIKTDFTEL